MTITLPDTEKRALVAALAKHRLTVTSSKDTGEYLCFEIAGHPHITVLSYWPKDPPGRRWWAEWIIETAEIWHNEFCDEAPTPSAAIEALLAHIAALAKETP